MDRGVGRRVADKESERSRKGNSQSGKWGHKGATGLLVVNWHTLINTRPLCYVTLSLPPSPGYKDGDASRDLVRKLRAYPDTSIVFLPDIVSRNSPTPLHPPTIPSLGHNCTALIKLSSIFININYRLARVASLGTRIDFYSFISFLFFFLLPLPLDSSPDKPRVDRLNK